MEVLLNDFKLQQAPQWHNWMECQAIHLVGLSLQRFQTRDLELGCLSLACQILVLFPELVVSLPIYFLHLTLFLECVADSRLVLPLNWLSTFYWWKNHITIYKLDITPNTNGTFIRPENMMPITLPIKTYPPADVWSPIQLDPICCMNPYLTPLFFQTAQIWLLTIQHLKGCLLTG